MSCAGEVLDADGKLRHGQSCSPSCETGYTDPDSQSTLTCNGGILNGSLACNQRFCGDAISCSGGHCSGSSQNYCNHNNKADCESVAAHGKTCQWVTGCDNEYVVQGNELIATGGYANNRDYTVQLVTLSGDRSVQVLLTVNTQTHYDYVYVLGTDGGQLAKLHGEATYRGKAAAIRFTSNGGTSWDGWRLK